MCMGVLEIDFYPRKLFRIFQRYLFEEQVLFLAKKWSNQVDLFQGKKFKNKQYIMDKSFKSLKFNTLWGQKMKKKH